LNFQKIWSARSKTRRQTQRRFITLRRGRCAREARAAVKVGELEVFVPANILEYELERAPGESDEDYEATKATFNAVFSAALK
jgi:hypothetical protein